MNVRPLAGYCLIDPSEAEKQTEGGLLIPPSVMEKQGKGTIIAMGKAGKDEEVEVAQGNIVIFKRWGGESVKVDGKEMQLVKYADIIGVYE